MGCQSCIGSGTPLDATTRNPRGRTQGYRRQWSLTQQPCVESNHRGIVNADGPTSLRRLLPSFDGNCWTARNAAQLLHRLTDPRKVLGENRHHQRCALDIWDSPNQRWPAVPKHDLEWCQPTEHNDWQDFEDHLCPQPVPFIDLRRDAARRALFIVTPFLRGFFESEVSAAGAELSGRII